MQRKGFALHSIKEAVIMRDLSAPSCGGRPMPPCSPAPTGGYLMQQIIGAGRVYLRYQRFSLPVCDLPCGAQPPLRLTCIQADENGIRAQRRESGCRGGAALDVHIPVSCTVCDACGDSFCLSSFLDVPVQLRLFDPRHADCARASANAFVRLARPCDCRCGEQLEAWLDVCVEAWLTACRPMYSGNCPPPCPPPLPLYPQPCPFR